MEYILDPSGLGRSKADILQVFNDVRNGDNFNEAFRNTFHCSLADFESGIFDKLFSYLERANANNIDKP